MKLDNTAIGKIADRIYRDRFGDDVIESVSAENIIDWTGDEAIRVSITIKPGTAVRLKGDDLSDAGLDLQDGLTAAGEERFAHTSFGEVGEIFETGDEAEEIEEVEFGEDDVRPRP